MTKKKNNSELTREEMEMSYEEFIEAQLKCIKKEQELSNKDFEQKNKNNFPFGVESRGKIRVKNTKKKVVFQ